MPSPNGVAPATMRNEAVAEKKPRSVRYKGRAAQRKGQRYKKKKYAPHDPPASKSYSHTILRLLASWSHFLLCRTCYFGAKHLFVVAISKQFARFAALNPVIVSHRLRRAEPNACLEHHQMTAMNVDARLCLKYDRNSPDMSRSRLGLKRMVSLDALRVYALAGS